MMRVFFAVFLMMLMGSTQAFADEMDELEGQDVRIEYLLSLIEDSDITFIRNGEEYRGKKAGEHLRLKLTHAPDEITAEQFIARIATKSSRTGEPYFVKLNNGAKIESAVWLTDKLEHYKQ